MDYMIRATAADNQIRAFAATTREMVETARAAHNTSAGKAADRRRDDGDHDERR